MAAQKIRVLLIFEILGRPPEHIKESLDEFVSKLGEQKGVELVCKTIHEPKPFEDNNAKDLFTTFAEVEVILDNLNVLFAVVLNMLPSSIEIIQPEEVRLTNCELTTVLSELTLKLHKYDEIAKTITIENGNLVNQINAMQEQMKNRAASPNITFTTDSDEDTGDKKKEKVREKSSSVKKVNSKKKK